MKIIEFCGTPGCGKSTLCDMLEERLRSEGKKVINLQKREKCDTPYKKLKKIFRILCYKAYPKNVELKKSLYDLANKQNDKKTSKKWADRILEANWLIHQAEKQRVDFALFDEGPIQFLTALLGDGIEADNRVLKSINSCLYQNDVQIYYGRIALAENISRLRNRKRHGDRFAEGTTEEIGEKLRKKKISIEQVLSALEMQYSVLDMEQSNAAFEALVPDIERINDVK